MRIGLFIAHNVIWLVVGLILLAAARNAFMRFEFRSGLVGLLSGWVAQFVATLLVMGSLAISGGCARHPDTVATAPAVATPTVDTPPVRVEPAAAPPIADQIDPCWVSDRSIELIIAHEIGSPELYTRKYMGIVCPGGPSGPTGGVGYDFGYRDASVIVADWSLHPENARLAGAAGIKGPSGCRAYQVTVPDIRISYPLARRVFDRTSLVEYVRLSRRAFGQDDFCAAPANTRGALTSLVFNRGASMSGPNRSEMRAIRDECLPARDWGCVARALRTMARVWRGSDIERTMERRRNDEAELAEAS